VSLGGALLAGSALLRVEGLGSWRFIVCQATVDRPYMPPPKQRYRQGSETDTIPHGCQRKAEWLAANGNTEHPSPLKAKEYRRIFQAFVGARKHHRADGSLKCYREIARRRLAVRGVTNDQELDEAGFPSVFSERWEVIMNLSIRPTVADAPYRLRRLYWTRSRMHGQRWLR